MMSYFLPIVLLALASALFLLIFAHWGVSAPPADNDRATLIALYRANLAAHPEQRDELDYRLYHDLRAKRRQRYRAGALPLWTYSALLGVFFAAGYFWYLQSGQPFWTWQQLVKPLQPELLRSQYLGDLSPLQTHNPVLYCQALQQQIDHRDRKQLDILGRCLTAYNDYRAASEVYARLHFLFPDDSDAAFNYAQTTLFAHPEQAMPADIEAILQQQASKNPVAKILLAASYDQHGQKARAAVLWGELRRDLPANNPLAKLIPSTDKSAPPAPVHAANGATITVTIDPALLHDLPATARLFVTASKQGQRLPIAVQALPPAPQQVIHLSDDNSMMGAKLSQEAHLTFRALLSASGKVTGDPVAKAESDATPDATVTLHLSAP